ENYLGRTTRHKARNRRRARRRAVAKRRARAFRKKLGRSRNADLIASPKAVFNRIDLLRRKIPADLGRPRRCAPRNTSSIPAVLAPRAPDLGSGSCASLRSIQL